MDAKTSDAGKRARSNYDRDVHAGMASALPFDTIEGYPKGYRFFSDAMRRTCRDLCS